MNYQLLSRMPSAYNVTPLYEDKIEALISAGYYSNKSEVVRDALRNLFEHKKHLRLAVAVELYRDGKTSLSKAAEIALVNLEEFRKIILDRGIQISKGELFKGTDKLRNKKL